MLEIPYFTILNFVSHCSIVQLFFLTLGLLRGLEDRPVDAPLTERDLTKDTTGQIIRNKKVRTYMKLCYMCKQHLELWYIYVRVLYLWLCAAVSRALRGGVGDPCSVTLNTSRLFLSGRQRPWRVSMGESTRFRGGSAEEYHHNVISGQDHCFPVYVVLLVFYNNPSVDRRCCCVFSVLLSAVIQSSQIYFSFGCPQNYDVECDFSLRFALAE